MNNHRACRQGALSTNKRMKHTITNTAAALIFASSAVFAQDATKPAAETPAPKMEKMEPAEVKKLSSYGFGFRNGQRFAQEISQYGLGSDDINKDIFLKGILAGYSNDQPEFSEEEIGKAMQTLGESLQKREEEAGKANLAAAEKFLAENKSKEGVVTTESGLQYMIVTPGGDKKYNSEEHGDNPLFQVNYKGTLIDGTVFDESPAGQTVPMTFQVIPGFKEALELMPVDSKYKLFIPPSLAYGEQRRSPEIGPNTLLVFELEVKEIGKAPEQPQFQLPPQATEAIEAATKGEATSAE